MSSRMFMIVSKAPVYTLFPNPVSNISLSSSNLVVDVPPSQALLEFIAHASIDMVQEQMYSNNSNYLKVVDSFNDIYVSAYVTIGNTILLLLIQPGAGVAMSKYEEQIKAFFNEVNDLFLRKCIDPFHKGYDQEITSQSFDRSVRNALRKHRLV